MPCARKSAPPIFLASSFEHVDEQLADDLALLLGIVDVGQLLQEQVFGLNVHQRNVVMIAEEVVVLSVTVTSARPNSR